jgi:hypothetical protein
MNASGSATPQIIISGGTVDLTVVTGDTDAIDSNGTCNQTGGFVIARSALSWGVGGALDTQDAASLTGDTFVGVGVNERVTASAGSNQSTGPESRDTD